MGAFELGRVRAHVNGRSSSCALERGCVRARAHSNYSGAYDPERSSSCPRARVSSHAKELRLVRWARSSSGAHELTSAGEFELVRARARACPSYHAHWAHDCLSSRSRVRVSSHGALELGRVRAHVNGRVLARTRSSALERSRVRAWGGRPGGWEVPPAAPSPPASTPPQVRSREALASF